MDGCNVMAGIEMSGSTTDNKCILAANAGKSGRNPAQAIISDFKKKLESLGTAEQPAVMIQGMPIMPGQDHSMATNAAAQAMPQGVVGILEGFGLLDYQTDIGAASAEAAQLQTAQAENADAQPAQQIPMSGEFARMLHNEQPGGRAQNAQPQAAAGAEEYSGSLESTNSDTATTAEAALTQGQQAAMLLRPKLTVEGKPQTKAVPVETTQVKAVPAQTMKAETVPAKTAQNAPGQAEAKPAGAPAQAAQMPQDAAQEQAPANKKAEVVPATAADAPLEPMVHAGVEAPAAGAQQADASADAVHAQKTTPDFVKDNVICIVDKAHASVHEGRYEFDVDLKPDFLGRVNIRLTMEGGKVRMHVRTEDAATKALFTDQTGSLQSALKEKGIVISTVDVSYQEPMAAGREAFGQQAGGGGQSREGQRGWSGDGHSGSELYDATAPAAELLGGSSVEYLA